MSIVLEPCLLQPCFHVAGGKGFRRFLTISPFVVLSGLSRSSHVFAGVRRHLFSPPEVSPSFVGLLPVCLVWSELVWCLVWSGLVWCLVWSGLNWSGVWSGVWSGLAGYANWLLQEAVALRSGPVRSGLACSGPVRSGPVRPGLDWSGLVWSGLA